jgi:putative phosphoribosyl transferase
MMNHHRFLNRTEAAKRLAAELQRLHLTNGVILAIPRGGVPIGYEIAKSLHFPLDIFLSKKIGHPENPEYAIGSITLDSMVLNSETSNVSDEYIREQTEVIRQNLRERYKKFRGNRPPLHVEGKTVILTDDGVATGNTLFAAITALRKQKPERIIVAVPVAPSETAEKLGLVVDQLVCLMTQEDFQSVGQYYQDFQQVDDEDVLALLWD